VDAGAGRWATDEVSGEARDQAEASQLMDLRESDIVPLFFTRDADGIPSELWRRIQRPRNGEPVRGPRLPTLARSCGAALPSIDMSWTERSAA
jgi:hypothetical protein